MAVRSASAPSLQRGPEALVDHRGLELDDGGVGVVGGGSRRREVDEDRQVHVVARRRPAGRSGVVSGRETARRPVAPRSWSPKVSWATSEPAGRVSVDRPSRAWAQLEVQGDPLGRAVVRRLEAAPRELREAFELVGEVADRLDVHHDDLAGGVVRGVGVGVEGHDLDQAVRQGRRPRRPGRSRSERRPPASGSRASTLGGSAARAAGSSTARVPRPGRRG